MSDEELALLLSVDAQLPSSTPTLTQAERAACRRAASELCRSRGLCGTNRLAMKRLVELARFPRESTRCDRERRSQTRYPLSIAINGVPIDGQGKPTGLPLSLTLCDIAEAGAGLTTFDRLEAGLLLLQVVIPHEGVASLIGCVEWLKSVGKITRFGMSFPTEG